MWCYRVFKRDGQIVDDAWFEWDFNGQIGFTLIRNSTIFFISEVANNPVLQKMSLTSYTIRKCCNGIDPSPYIDLIDFPSDYYVYTDYS